MRSIKLIIVVLLICSIGQVSAQYLGQMTSARSLGMGQGVTSGYAVFSDHSKAVVGSLRYGFANQIEGRARLGYIDPDVGDGSILFGADFKYQLWKFKQNNNPFDMALGGGLEFADFEGGNVLSLVGVVVGSIPFTLANQSKIEPYGQFHLRWQRVSNDFLDESESDLKAGVNLGVVFSLPSFTDFTAEIQLDDETAFYIGIDILQF